MNIINITKKNKTLSVIILIEIVILCLLIGTSFGRRDVISINSSSGPIAKSTSKQADGQEKTIFTQNLAVKPTAYDVTINYKSVMDPDNPDKKSYDDITGTLIFSLNRHGLLSNNLDLSDGMTSAKTRIWLTTWVPIKDLSVNISYNGKGQLTVQSIVLRENILFRFTKILCFLVLAAFIDLAYMFISGRYFAVGDRKRQLLLWGIIGTIVISSLPVLGNSFYYGDDCFFHLHRIVSLADAIKSGNIPQRLQLTSMHGYGYASPLYYGELFLFVPACLYLLCLPLQLCYQIYVILVNIATCLITYWCVRKITEDNEISVLTSFVYTCSAYRLVNVYQRWAVGEYTAVTFLPLIVYGFYHLYMMEDREKFRLKDYFPLVLGLTGVIQTHLLTLEMTAFVIIIFILFHLRATFRLKRFTALVKAVLLTFMLNAWFLVPMLQSFQYKLAVSGTQNYMGSWSIDPGLIFSILDPGINGHHITLGSSMLAGIILFVMIRIMRGSWKINPKMMRALNTLEGLGILTAVCALPYVQWDNIYNLNKKAGQILSVIQFSWRYFEFAAVLLTFGTAVSMLIIRTNASSVSYYTAVGSLILCTALFTSSFMSAVSLQGKASDESGEPSYYEYYINNDMPYIGNNISGGEYLPYNANKNLLTENTVHSPSGVEVSDYRTVGNRRIFSVNNGTEKAAEVSIPLLAYDNYHAFLDDSSEAPVSADENGLVQIRIPARYEGTVTVRYIEPVLWRLSEAVTLITIMILCIYAIIRKRRQRY